MRIRLKEDLFESTNGIHTLLIDAINRKWDMIEGFNSLIVNLKSENFDDMIPVIESILEDEHNHIGQLQQLVELISPSAKEIEVGKEDALEILDNPEEENIFTESYIRESVEKEVRSWLDSNFGVGEWKPKFNDFVKKLKPSTNTTTEVTLAIKKFAKDIGIKPQQIMSALNESLRNQDNINRNKTLMSGGEVRESLQEDIDENASTYYVSYYEEKPVYHPEEGGYYMATCELIDSDEYASLDEAREAIDELGSEDGQMEKISDEFWLDRSKYIGNDRFYIIETTKGSEEKGDEIYQ